MTSRARLIAIILLCALAVAVPVSSQDVTKLFGYGSPWAFCGPGEVSQPAVEGEPAREVNNGQTSNQLSGSFRDNNYRIAQLEPARKDAVANEPSLELLPPVNDEGAMQPMTSDWESTASSGFEQIPTPLPAAILDPDLLNPSAKGKDASKDKAAGGCGETKKEDKTSKIWSGNIEMGMNGAEGNSQTFNLHIGFNLKRKTKRSTLTYNLDYNKANNESLITVNRLIHEARLEIPHTTKPWTWYAHESTDYDEFQPWDVQVNADTGVGYRLIESEPLDLTGRFGGGFSHEIGGPEETYVPELLFGGELERRINKKHKYKISVEYFPDVTNFNQFRMLDKASWEILLDEKHNFSISLNVIDTINRPNPEGKEEDFTYSAALHWNF